MSAIHPQNNSLSSQPQPAINPQHSVPSQPPSLSHAQQTEPLAQPPPPCAQNVQPPIPRHIVTAPTTPTVETTSVSQQNIPSAFESHQLPLAINTLLPPTSPASLSTNLAPSQTHDSSSHCTQSLTNAFHQFAESQTRLTHMINEQQQRCTQQFNHQNEILKPLLQQNVQSDTQMQETQVLLRCQCTMLERIMESDGCTFHSHDELSNAITTLSQRLEKQSKSLSTKLTSTKDNPQAKPRRNGHLDLQQQNPEPSIPDDVKNPGNSTNASPHIPTTMAITTDSPPTNQEPPCTPAAIQSAHLQTTHSSLLPLLFPSQ